MSSDSLQLYGQLSGIVMSFLLKCDLKLLEQEEACI